MKCPHCGMPFEKVFGVVTTYQCGTLMRFGGATPLMSDACREIAQLNQRVRVLEEMVRKSERSYADACNALHYPECWDTAAYPDLFSAVKEVFSCNPTTCTYDASGSSL